MSRLPHNIEKRLLVCHHVKDGHVNHYVGGKLVDACEFRRAFRELGGKLLPARPQSTGFGYRIVWEVV